LRNDLTPSVNPSRIAIVGPLPPPAGGMANQTLQLSRLLGEEGVYVAVSSRPCRKVPNGKWNNGR